MTTEDVKLPEISPETFSALEANLAEERKTVTAALAAIREKYKALAKYGDRITIAYRYIGNSNYRQRDERYYTNATGKEVRGLLALDAFDSTHSEQYRGRLTGSRVYLTEAGEWLEITRTGHWSSWQGEPESWNCGVPLSDDPEDDDAFDERSNGNIQVIDDQQMGERWEFTEILKDLAKTLEELKIPERMTSIQKRTAQAAQLLKTIQQC